MATIRNFSPEEAKARFESLPPDIKDALYGVEMNDVLTSAGEKYHLHFDQLGSLESQISAVMLGFTEPQDFPTIIKERLDVTPEIAASLAHDIDEKLFKKIRDSLKKLFPLPEPTPPQAPSEPPAVSQHALTKVPIPTAPTKATAAPPQQPTQAPRVVPTPPAPTEAAKSPPPSMNMPTNVDHMLSAPSVAPQQTIDVGLTPRAQPPQTKKYPVDPYREPAE